METIIAAWAVIKGLLILSILLLSYVVIMKVTATVDEVKRKLFKPFGKSRK